MQVSGTIEGTHCPMIIILIPQKKRGVAVNCLHTYVGPTYVDFVVATIRYRYYFQINMKVTGIPFLMTISKHIKFGSAGKLDNMNNSHIIKHFKAVIGACYRQALSMGP